MKKKPVKTKVQRKPAPRKRVSNRVYPAIKCLKTDCPEVFTPSSKKQKYCCDQHRIDQNNDNRDIKAAKQIFATKINANNNKILGKMYAKTYQLVDPQFNETFLSVEGYNHDYYITATTNKATGEKISWSYDFGLECADRKLGTFIIHKR